MITATATSNQLFIFLRVGAWIMKITCRGAHAKKDINRAFPAKKAWIYRYCTQQQHPWLDRVNMGIFRKIIILWDLKDFFFLSSHNMPWQGARQHITPLSAFNHCRKDRLTSRPHFHCSHHARDGEGGNTAEELRGNEPLQCSARISHWRALLRGMLTVP